MMANELAATTLPAGRERRDREDKAGLPNLDPPLKETTTSRAGRGRSTSTDEISNPRPGER